MDVFLSYSHCDKELAQKIADALRAAGISVWFDMTEIPVGEAIGNTIFNGIKSCKIFMPIASKDASDSLWFTTEISMAMALRQEIQVTIKIFPIIVGNNIDSWLHPLLALYKGFYLKSPDAYGEINNDLIEEIKFAVNNFFIHETKEHDNNNDIIPDNITMLLRESYYQQEDRRYLDKIRHFMQRLVMGLTFSMGFIILMIVIAMIFNWGSNDTVFYLLMGILLGMSFLKFYDMLSLLRYRNNGTEASRE